MSVRTALLLATALAVMVMHANALCELCPQVLGATSTCVTVETATFSPATYSCIAKEIDAVGYNASCNGVAPAADANGAPPAQLCNGGGSLLPISFTLKETGGTQNLFAGNTTVYLGTELNPQLFACNNPGVSIIRNNAFDNLIACSISTPPLQQQTGNFSIFVYYQTLGNGLTLVSRVPGTPFTFSTPPVVTGVSGCDPDVTFDTTLMVNYPTTKNCPTSGFIDGEAEIYLYITGSNFYNFPGPTTLVLVNSVACTSPQLLHGAAGDLIKCKLPQGVGSSRSLQVQSGGRPSVAKKAVTYGSATITTMIGCLNSTNKVDGITGCSRNGGATIALAGTNFGASGAKLLVHGRLATNVLHDAVEPHKRLTFTLPQGTGPDRIVLFLQNGGFLTVSNATVSYTPCPLGQFQQPPPSVICETCGPALYTNKLDSDTCSSCPEGKYTGPSYPNYATSCKDCEPGTEKSVRLGKIECDFCAPGKHQGLPGQPTCEPCLAGKYAAGGPSEMYNRTVPAGYGTVNCTDCPVGKYSSIAGSTACDRCEGTRYQLASGQTTCQTCSTGQYHPPDGETCLLCPLGATCVPSGVVAADGYFVYFDEDRRLHSDPCLPGYCVACDPETALTNQARALTNESAGVVFSCCSKNRVDPNNNPFCGACSQDYFLWADECSLCKETDPGLVFLFLLIAWVSVIVFHLVAQLASPDMRIFINFIQFVFLFLLTQSSSLSAWLAVFNFNIAAALGKTCVAPLTDMQRLASGLYVPAIGFLLLCVNVGVHYILWRLLRMGYCQWECCTNPAAAAQAEEEAGVLNGPASERRRSTIAARTAEATAANNGVAPATPVRVAEYDGGCCSPNPLGVAVQTWRLQSTFRPIFDSYRRTALAFIATSYPSLTQSVLTFFSCKSFNHDSFVTAYPAISCTNSESYKALIPIFALVLVVVIILPILFFARLYQLNQAGVLFDKDIRFVYGGLIDGYTASKYYWEVFVLIKRLVIAVVALDAYNNQLPQKFTYLCLCNIVFLGIHFLAKPFSLGMDNYAESLSLITLVLLSLFLINAPAPLDANYSAGLTAMCFTVAIIFLLRIILVRYRALLDFTSRRKTTTAAKAKAKKRASGVKKAPADFGGAAVPAGAADTTAATTTTAAGSGFGGDVSAAPSSGAGAGSEIAMVPLGNSAVAAAADAAAANSASLSPVAPVSVGDEKSAPASDAAAFPPPPPPPPAAVVDGGVTGEDAPPPPAPADGSSIIIAPVPSVPDGHTADQI